MKIKMPCIVCPNSCDLEIEYIEKNGKKEIIRVTGNSCARGITYATNEITHPMRMVTTTIRIDGSSISRLPVILSGEIPKDKIFDVVEAIKKVHATAPIKEGSILSRNILGLGVDLVSSRTVD